MADSKQLSKQNWDYPQETTEAIQVGCLQRIADATEKMAGNYVKMETDLAMYKRWYYEKMETVAKLHRKISAYQGVITKLKKAGRKI